MMFLEKWALPWALLIALVAAVQIACGTLQKISTVDRLRAELAAVQVACGHYLALPVEEHVPELDAACSGAP